jgi:hypothetical protein
MAGRGCTCPADGAWLCPQCRTYLARAQGQETPRAPAMSEAQFLTQLREIVKRLPGWRCYHTHDSRHSVAGYPDVTLVRPVVLGPIQPRPGRLIFAELKVGQKQPTIEQQYWLADLAASVPGVEVYVWRPEDLPEIVTLLQR